MVNDLFDLQENQLIVSAELLYLLQWIVDNESSAIKKIIARSLKKGLKKQLLEVRQKKENNIPAEDIHNSIVEFLGSLEILLSESMDEDSTKRVLQKLMVPSIENIDSSICNNDVVSYSLEEASSKVEEDPNLNPKDVLFKEILKNWNPHKKNQT